MKPLYKGLIVALLHVLMVASLGAKLLYDRATQPRVWVQAAAHDPEMPIRGRYAAIRVQVDTNIKVKAEQNAYDFAYVRLEARYGRLHAVADQKSEVVMQWDEIAKGVWVPVLRDPVLFFLPDYVDDPTQVRRNEFLWVEVTVPKKGPPRPIQLAVHRNGEFEVLKTR